MKSSYSNLSSSLLTRSIWLSRLEVDSTLMISQPFQLHAFVRCGFILSSLCFGVARLYVSVGRGMRSQFMERGLLLVDQSFQDFIGWIVIFNRNMLLWDAIRSRLVHCVGISFKELACYWLGCDQWDVWSILCPCLHQWWFCPFCVLWASNFSTWQSDVSLPSWHSRLELISYVYALWAAPRGFMKKWKRTHGDAFVDFIGVPSHLEA